MKKKVITIVNINNKKNYNLIIFNIFLIIVNNYLIIYKYI